MDQPPKGHLHAHIIEAVVPPVNSWDKVKELPHACDDLQEEDQQNTTPKNIGKTGSPWHLFVKTPTNDSIKGPTVIDPMYNFRGHGLVSS
jgi:hypothetical protein